MKINEKQLKDSSESVQLEAVKQYGHNIRYIENPSLKVQWEATREIADSIKWIKEPSELLMEDVLSRDGYSYYYLKDRNLSEKFQLTAVRNAGQAIQHIDNPSIKVIEAAITNDPRALRWLPNTEEIQILALETHGKDATIWIENPISELVKERVDEIDRVALFEALKPSQYREYTKKWNKKRHSKIFDDPKYEGDKNRYRIYIPIDEKFHPDKMIIDHDKIEDEASQMNLKYSTAYSVILALKDLGYKIIDYKKGLAGNIENPKRQMRIGKLLQKGKKDVMKKDYDSDSLRSASKNEYEIVISRHPYDLAGMSTNRGWTSCMNIDDGEYKRYVGRDIKSGTIIAYAIKKGDRNIKDPVGRVLIKPFTNKENPKETFLGVEGTVYGTAPDGFKYTITEWANEINNQKLDIRDFVEIKLHSRIYNDSVYKDREIKSASFKELTDSNINDLNDADQIRIIKYRSGYFLDIKNPSNKVKIETIKIDPMAIKYIDKPTEYMQLIAVKKNPGMYKEIQDPDPSERVKVIAVSGASFLIKYMHDPSEKIQVAAATNDPQILVSYRELEFCEKAQIAAIKKQSRMIGYINYATDKVKILAVKIDPSNIALLRKGIPEKTFEIAIRKNPGFVTLARYSKNTKKYVRMARRIAKLRGQNVIDEVEWKIKEYIEDEDK